MTYDCDGDGVYEQAPMAGDADGNGKPYEVNDVYWTMRHIAQCGAYGKGAVTIPTVAGDVDGDGDIDTSDLFDIMYECALRGAGLKK